MAKRFQTYFGVPIPPWKEEKIGAGSTTIRFILQGRVPSKKNHMMAVAVRKEAKKYINGIFKKKNNLTILEALEAVKAVYAKIRPNSDYQAFVKAQKPVLMEQMKFWSGRLQAKGLIFPVPRATLSIRFYFDTRYVQDTVNKQQSVQDLLVEAGVISNDDYGTLNPIHAASACYYEEIVDTITFISISFKL